MFPLTSLCSSCLIFHLDNATCLTQQAVGKFEQALESQSDAPAALVISLQVVRCIENTSRNGICEGNKNVELGKSRILGRSKPIHFRLVTKVVET